MTATYHMVGIKGSGMSALAQLLTDMGNYVQGEDGGTYYFTQAPLEQRGIPFYLFGEAPLTSGMKVIVSNAYGPDHPAVARCREAGLEVEWYHHFLGQFMSQFVSIAVTGSHGKTTTTGMLSHTLSGVVPTSCLIGDGTGRGTPDARFFVFESCEYKRHFLAYRPELAVITNIDFDHPDYYADLDDVRSAFEEMADKVGRKLIVCGDDPQVRRLKTDKELIHYGFQENNELQAVNLKVENGGTAFDVYGYGKLLGRFILPFFGRHNVLNALAVIGVAVEQGLDLARIRERLATFPGVKRRFSEQEWRSNILIDDYAHHPSEIRATLEAVRSKYPERKVVSVFQPHTFSRLEKLLEDFALSLDEADDVFLCEIFGSAREQQGTVSIEQLRDRIPHSQLISENSVSDLLGYEDSVLVFMGAGDIGKYQTKLLELGRGETAENTLQQPL